MHAINDTCCVAVSRVSHFANRSWLLSSKLEFLLSLYFDHCILVNLYWVHWNDYFAFIFVWVWTCLSVRLLICSCSLVICTTCLILSRIHVGVLFMVCCCHYLLTTRRVTLFHITCRSQHSLMSISFFFIFACESGPSRCSSSSIPLLSPLEDACEA